MFNAITTNSVQISTNVFLKLIHVKSDPQKCITMVTNKVVDQFYF